MNGNEAERQPADGAPWLEPQSWRRDTSDAVLYPGETGAFEAIPLAADRLRSGRNVIAVQVHQSARTSSDLSFALELKVRLAPAWWDGCVADGTFYVGHEGGLTAIR